MENNFNDWAKKIYEANKEKGFWIKERNCCRVCFQVKSILVLLLRVI